MCSASTSGSSGAAGFSASASSRLSSPAATAVDPALAPRPPGPAWAESFGIAALVFVTGPGLFLFLEPVLLVQRNRLVRLMLLELLDVLAHEGVSLVRSDTLH